MRRRVMGLIGMMLMLILCCAGARAEGLAFVSAPDTLRPGKVYSITVSAPGDGQLSVMLTDAQGYVVYDIFSDYPVTAGENTIHWDGLRADYSVIDQGDYTLQLLMADESAEMPVRLGAPYPLISHLRQSDAALMDAPLQVQFETSEAGTAKVQLRDSAKRITELMEMPAQLGENTFSWDGTVNGQRVQDGRYTLIVTLHTANGMESMQHHAPVEVISEVETPDVVITDATDAPQPEATPAPAEASPEAAATEAPIEATPEPDRTSPPYSTIDDGSYWSMTPGELDDAVIWEIMTQPITVHTGVDQKEHIYVMENPDGTGEKIAQVHGQSQGLHVIGEVNEHGYVQVEVFSSYDDVYTPQTEIEREHALELKTGYILAKGLKTIEVQQDMGLLIDKKTQRMYLFVNGKRETEFIISTGLIVDDKYHYESTVGEFITVSHSGGFYSNKYMYCDMAIRINGGILLHEVPYEPLGDGSKNYKAYESLLGTKASHSCIRIQRVKNEGGYNHRWLWENLKHGKPYKVLVWDDLNRYDNPTTWYPNP